MKEQKSLRSRVFTLAWKMYRNEVLSTFSECLASAWLALRTYSVKTVMSSLFSRLSFVNIKGTKDYWSIVNSKEIRKTEDPDVLEMIEAGHIPLGDILKHRRRIANKFNFTPRQEKVKRPRIVTGNYEKICLATTI